jgi:hypothetical protein
MTEIKETYKHNSLQDDTLDIVMKRIPVASNVSIDDVGCLLLFYVRRWVHSIAPFCLSKKEVATASGLLKLSLPLRLSMFLGICVQCLVRYRGLTIVLVSDKRINHPKYIQQIYCNLVQHHVLPSHILACTESLLTIIPPMTSSGIKTQTHCINTVINVTSTDEWNTLWNTDTIVMFIDDDAIPSKATMVLDEHTITIAVVS